MNIKLFTILLILLLSAPREENWVERKNKDNITIFTRKVLTSVYKEIKCATRVKATLGAIVKVLSEAEHYTQWIYNCDSAVTVKKISDTEIISYQHMYVPWPATDRDVVSRLRITQDKVTKVVTLKSDIVHGLIREIEGTVRVKDFHSKYKLIPAEDGWVEIEYELGTDPGGLVPAWLVNMFIVNAPYTTQENLNRLVQNPFYSSTRLSFISEPQQDNK